jgi:hypothetical protein
MNTLERAMNHFINNPVSENWLDDRKMTMIRQVFAGRVMDQIITPFYPLFK